MGVPRSISQLIQLASVILPSATMNRKCVPKNAIPVVIASVLVAAISGAAGAEVIDLKNRDNNIRLLIEGPANPTHVVALFAGGDGAVKINDDGSIGWLSGNFAVRTRTMLHAHGMATAVLAAPDNYGNLKGSRGRDDYITAVGNVIGYLRTTFSKPVWLHGTSRGTISIVLTVPKIKDSAKKPDGIVLSASVMEENNFDNVFYGDLDEITGPVLVLHHKNDPCWVTPVEKVKDLLKALKKAWPKKAVLFKGGGQSASGRGCGAQTQHGFIDIEQQVIDVMALFIKNPG